MLLEIDPVGIMIINWVHNLLAQYPKTADRIRLLQVFDQAINQERQTLNIHAPNEQLLVYSFPTMDDDKLTVTANGDGTADLAVMEPCGDMNCLLKWSVTLSEQTALAWAEYIMDSQIDEQEFGEAVTDLQRQAARGYCDIKNIANFLNTVDPDDDATWECACPICGRLVYKYDPAEDLKTRLATAYPIGYAEYECECDGPTIYIFILAETHD